MTEYLIEIVQQGAVVRLVHVEFDGRVSTVAPSVASYGYVSKYRVKARAEKVAAKLVVAEGMVVRVAPSYGGFIQGQKSIVPGPKFNPKGIRG